MIKISKKLFIAIMIILLIFTMFVLPMIIIKLYENNMMCLPFKEIEVLING